MRYEANEKYRNDSISLVKDERNKIIKEEKKKYKINKNNNNKNNIIDKKNDIEKTGDEKMEKLFEEQKN